jgi:energy-coupling factor transporter transmembrane protein EcfT
VDISLVDRAATTGVSALHRTAPAAKLAATALVLGAVIVSTNVLVVATIAMGLFSVVLGQRLKWLPLLVLSLYPGIFAALYAFAAWTGGLWASLIVFKAVTSALAVLLLMFTTPYPQVFAPIQRLMPAVIGDSLLMTYRSLFLLLEKFSHTLTAARLRAGVVGVNPIKSAATVTRSLGGVLLYSIDLSQRTHDIMHLRGYDGRLVVSPMPSASVGVDRFVVVLAAAVAAFALAWRIWFPVLNPYAWLPLAASAAVLVIVAAARLLKGDSA